VLEVGVESSSASRKSAVAMAVYVMVRDRPGGAPSIWACGFHVGWMDGMGWMDGPRRGWGGMGWDGTGEGNRIQCQPMPPSTAQPVHWMDGPKATLSAFQRACRLFAAAMRPNAQGTAAGKPART